MATPRFLPRSAREITDLDFRMRCKLAESVHHVCDAAKMAAGVGELDVNRLSASIVGHRQSPGVFARYFEAVYALAAGRADQAAGLLREMGELAEYEPHFEVKALSVASMGADATHYARMLNAGENSPIFAPSEPQYWDDFDVRVGRALALVEAASPPLAAEIRALVVQAIGAEPRDPAHSFGAISSLTLWGAATINLETHRTVLDVAEALVHEAAHLLLFALALDEPLVANPDTDRFVSPLRSDPRPMDGVFHATFVCARLFYFYSTLAERQPENLSCEDLATVETRLPLIAARFEDGLATVVAGARLTACGRAIFDSTLDFMRGRAEA